MQIQTLDIYKQLTTARLPALPQVLLALLDLCDRDDVGIAEIGEVVAKDAAITARIVGIANSPYYRPDRALDNIDQCLAVLGTGTVRRLALNQSVVELFGRFQQAKDFDLRYFWFHGLSVAVTARRLAQRLGYGNQEEAYLAGLLHDVGQLALLSVAAERYLPMFKNFTGEYQLMRQEQEAFGLTHAEVGAWLAQRWNLHAFFVDSILYHHESLARVREAHPLVQIVMLANMFNALPEAEVVASETELAFWKIDIRDILALVAAAQNEARTIAAELGIELPADPALLAGAEAAPDAAPAKLAEAVSMRMEGLSAQQEALFPQTLAEAKFDLLRGSALLFGAHGTALFMPGDDALLWQKVEGCDDRVGEVSIDLTASDSRIALAYKGRIGLAGLPGQPCNLADAQVLGILGGERLLCLPLAYDGKALGVLTIAMDVGTVEQFARKQALLVTFAREAGRRLGLALKQQAQIDGVRLDTVKRHELHARKLVHEASNPLGVVRNYLAILRQQIGDQDKTQQEFSLIESELRRVARILQQFKQIDAGDSRDLNKGRVNVNSLMNEVVQFCRMGKHELQGVEVIVSPAQDLPAITTDADKLKQILTNLIFNAAEALPRQGRISLTSALWRGGRDQDSLELTVSDNGPGLPREVLARLYQPVQTEKGDDHAGLGLSIVGSLVEELGGMMQCNSSPSGTHFKILLPVAGVVS